MSSSLQIYNTLTHKKEPFTPIEAGKVRMYVCGPTVYGLLHVGNFRGPIFFNLVRNWLTMSGYQVTFAYNYTDVDDKIINRANEERVSSQEIADKYIEEFRRDFAALELTPHDLNPKVTETMPEIVKLVQTLVDRGVAYVTADGEVLFSVRDFEGYGKLSHKNIDDLEAGARVAVDTKKKDPADFALWKPAKPGEPKWGAPWSEGRPGWHIECSAMIHKIFGDSIDIHGGGQDLVFPHHENEIAQSEGATGKQLSRYWMHNNMITFGDKKMSKSLGNITTARDFLSKYNAEILKYMILSVHYRSLSDFSDQAVHFAVAALAKVYSALNLAEKTIAAGEALSAAGTPVKPGAAAKTFATALDEASAHAVSALNDDFNTPELFAAVYAIIRAFNTSVRLTPKPSGEMISTAIAFREWMHTQGALISLFRQPAGEYLRLLDDMLIEQKGIDRASVEALVAERTTVRAAKDFKRSDELRDQLLAIGISVQDTPQGSIWEVTK